MSHPSNDNIRDRIAELYDLIHFLESELDTAFSLGDHADADLIAVELYDSRKELAKLEGYFN